MSDDNLLRRADDGGKLCWLALRMSELWDFVDNRQIDKHAVSLGVFYGTVRVVEWAMEFASAHYTMTGAEMAMIMGAVLGPYMLLQGAVIKWYFSRGEQKP